MNKFVIRLFTFIFIMSCVQTTQAQALRCQSVFNDNQLSLTNFHETLKMLKYFSKDKLTPGLEAQLGMMEAMIPTSTSTENLNLLKILSFRLYKDQTGQVQTSFTNKKFESPDGKQSLRWTDINFGDPVATSKGLVKLTELIAMQQYKSVRAEHSFLTRLLNLKDIATKRKETLQRIENEMYLKALLYGHGRIATSSSLSGFLPWRVLKLERIALDKTSINILDQQGLEAFHLHITKKYGMRTSTEIVTRTMKNIMMVSGAISMAIVYFWMQQSSDYFENQMDIETGLEGKQFELFERVLNESAFKSQKDTLHWLNSQKFNNAELDQFVLDLNLETQN